MGQKTIWRIGHIFIRYEKFQNMHLKKIIFFLAKNNKKRTVDEENKKILKFFFLEERFAKLALRNFTMHEAVKIGSIEEMNHI